MSHYRPALIPEAEAAKLDSSLKRHTALIKRMRQSIGAENRDQILKDLDSLSLEKYIDEIASAAMEGVGRCKTEKDVWSAVEVGSIYNILFKVQLTVSQVISSLHRRFSKSFTPTLVALLNAALSAPPRAALSALAQEQREKDDSARITRQRPVLRVCAELALVGIIRDAPKRSGGEWVMKSLKELVCCGIRPAIHPPHKDIVIARSITFIPTSAHNLFEIICLPISWVGSAICEANTNFC